MAKQKKLALEEKKGVSSSESANSPSIKSIKDKRKIELNAATLVENILKQDITALSRAIPLLKVKIQNMLNRQKALYRIVYLMRTNLSVLALLGCPA